MTSSVNEIFLLKINNKRGNDLISHFPVKQKIKNTEIINAKIAVNVSSCYVIYPYN